MTENKIHPDERQQIAGSNSCKLSGHVLYIWFYYDFLTLHTNLLILKDANISRLLQILEISHLSQ